jgi:hypothetical protein
VVHIHTHPERFSDGFRAIDRKNGEELFDGQGMFATYTLNRRNQKLGVSLHGETDEASDIGGFLADGHRLHETGLRINHRALEQPGLFFVADVCAQISELLKYRVVNLIVDHHRLLGGADGSVVEGLGDDDVDHRGVQVCCLFQIDWGIARPNAGLPEL